MKEKERYIDWGFWSFVKRGEISPSFSGALLWTSLRTLPLPSKHFHCISLSLPSYYFQSWSMRQKLGERQKMKRGVCSSTTYCLRCRVQKRPTHLAIPFSARLRKVFRSETRSSNVIEKGESFFFLKKSGKANSFLFYPISREGKKGPLGGFLSLSLSVSVFLSPHPFLQIER